jgi:hypothetical protein
MIKVLTEKSHYWIMIRLGNFLETLCFIVLGWTRFPSWQIVTGVLIMFVVRYSNWTKFVTSLMYLPAIFIIKKEIYNFDWIVKRTRLNSMKLMVLDHRNRDGWHFDWINEGNFIIKINYESGNVPCTRLLVFV